MARTLVVAPHPDDAALSVGGTIGRCRGPVSLITVFGCTNYTRDGGFECDVEAVTCRRRSEDRAFAARFDLDWTYLEIRAAGVRCAEPASIFVQPRDSDALEIDRRQVGVTVEKGLRAAIERLAPWVIVAPAGIGGHRDHLLVRTVAEQLAAASGIATVYYEDLPYALAFSEEDLAAAMMRVDPWARPIYVPIGDGLAEKLSAARLYESQVDQSLVDSLRRAACRWGAPVERLWARPSVAFLKSLR
jgi:LmbE family N-acetylglucosaminyl deacetylase